MTRPPGVFWARTGPAPGAPLCEDAAHAVDERWHVRETRRTDGERVRQRVRVYACAVCWPDGRDG